MTHPLFSALWEIPNSVSASEHDNNRGDGAAESHLQCPNGSWCWDAFASRAHGGLLVVPSSQNFSRTRMDHIMRPAASDKRIRQIIINVPTVGARRQRDLEP